MNLTRSKVVGVLVVSAGVAAHFFLLIFLVDTQPSREETQSQLTKFSFGSPANQPSPRYQTAFADLFDSQSLFMPTRYNSAGSLSGVSGLQEASEVFSDFPPSLALGVLPILSPNPGNEMPEEEDLLPSSPAFVMSMLFRDVGMSSSVTQAKRAILSDSLSKIYPDNLHNKKTIKELENIPKIEFANGPVEVSIQLEHGRPVGRPVIWKDGTSLEIRSLMESYLLNPEVYLDLSDGYYKLSIYP